MVQHTNGMGTVRAASTIGINQVAENNVFTLLPKCTEEYNWPSRPGAQAGAGDRNADFRVADNLLDHVLRGYGAGGVHPQFHRDRRARVNASVCHNT